MATTLLRQRDGFLFVPANLLALCDIDGRVVPTRIEEIDRAGLFFISKVQVLPRSVFTIEFPLPRSKEVVRAVMTATFVERTWDGYGVGAQISCISSSSEAAWQRYYAKVAADSTPNYSATFRLTQFLIRQRVIALSGALSEYACQSLSDLGVEVKIVETPEAALEQRKLHPRALFVSTISDAQSAGHELCRRLTAEGKSALLLLISEPQSQASLDDHLYAGAAKVVAGGGSQAILVTRVVALLHTHHQLCGEFSQSLPREATLKRRPKLAVLLQEHRLRFAHAARAMLAMMALYFS